jgi:AcrR family transcriptional regulator
MERRKPGPEPRFTRQELARRALAIMDAQGSEGLTMRGLAEALGMGTMALYRYFPSKNDLVDAAIDLAAGEIELPERRTGPWKEQLAGLARELFEAGLRHPCLAYERVNRPLQSPDAMRVTGPAIALLVQVGLDERDAVAAFKALVVQTLGAAALVLAEERPASPAVASEFTSVGGRQAFELGLGAFLDGIELRAAR